MATTLTSFSKLRSETNDPFLKLYYEILSRFHVNDYDKALEAMNPELRIVIEACTKHMEAC